MVAKKLKAMHVNKSHRVDGNYQKLLMETVHQLSIPLVFILSLQEEMVPFQWKEANIIPFFKIGS